MAPVLKTGEVKASVGSNPTLSVVASLEAFGLLAGAFLRASPERPGINPSVVGVVEMPAAMADHHLGEVLIPADMNPQGSAFGILGTDLEVLPQLQSPQRLPALQRRSAPPCPWGDDRSIASLPQELCRSCILSRLDAAASREDAANDLLRTGWLR